MTVLTNRGNLIIARGDEAKVSKILLIGKADSSVKNNYTDR